MVSKRLKKLRKAIIVVAKFLKQNKGTVNHNEENKNAL